MFSARTISYQLLIVLCLLLLLEGGARIAHTMHSNSAKDSDWLSYTADLGWDRRPNFNGLDHCGARRTFDHRGLVSVDAARLQKPEGQFRALFLGDSNVYGYCLETDQTFVEAANRLLPQSTSINLGVNGHTSYQGYKSLLKYGKLLNPDIVFISYNFNDRRFVLKEEQADGEAAFQRLYASRLMRHLADVSYLVRFADFIGRKLSMGALGSSGLMAEVRLDKVRPRVDPQSYRANLIRMVDWARQHGSAVVFILLGDNPNETSALREGVNYLSEKNYEQAIKYLTFARDHPRSWFSALAGLYLSRAYREMGRADKAEQALSLRNAMTSTLGGFPIILDTEYNRIMREVAEKYGVPLVDAARELNKTPGVYFDFCHFDAQGHDIVARLVSGVIEAARSNVVAKRASRD